jgi:ribosomal protein L37AE/L43A
LQNLAMYEGARAEEASASGKVCPRCGTKGVEIVHTKRSRIYECPRCGLRWDRDKGVHYNMVYNYFARMVKEECDDDSVMAERVLNVTEGVAGKALAHPSVLARHQLTTPVPLGESRWAASTLGAPARGAEEAVKVKPPSRVSRGGGGRAHDALERRRRRRLRRNEGEPLPSQRGRGGMWVRARLTTDSAFLIPSLRSPPSFSTFC